MRQTAIEPRPHDSHLSADFANELLFERLSYVRADWHGALVSWTPISTRRCQCNHGTDRNVKDCRCRRVIAGPASRTVTSADKDFGSRQPVFGDTKSPSSRLLGVCRCGARIAELIIHRVRGFAFSAE